MNANRKDIQELVGLYENYVEQDLLNDSSQEYITQLRELISAIEEYFDDNIVNNSQLFKYVVENDCNYYMLKGKDKLYFKRRDIVDINKTDESTLEEYLKYIDTSFYEDEYDNMIISESATRSPIIEYVFDKLGLQDLYDEVLQLKEECDKPAENPTVGCKLISLLSVLFNRVEELSNEVSQLRQECESLKQLKSSPSVNEISCSNSVCSETSDDSKLDITPTPELDAVTDRLIITLIAHASGNQTVYVFARSLIVIFGNQLIKNVVIYRLKKLGWRERNDLDGCLYHVSEKGVAWYGYSTGIEKTSINLQSTQRTIENISEICAVLRDFFDALYDVYVQTFGEMKRTGISQSEKNNYLNIYRKEKQALNVLKKRNIKELKHDESFIEISKPLLDNYIRRKMLLLNDMIQYLSR